MTDNDGAKYYDRCLPVIQIATVCAQRLSQLFNRQWLNNDNGGSLPTMARSDHERVLLAYGCAFFRRTLAGHGTEGFLTGSELPSATPTSLVHLTFKWTSATTVDDHQQNNGIALNSFNLATTQSGPAGTSTAGRAAAHQFNNSFCSDTIGMVAVPHNFGDTFRSAPAGVKSTVRSGSASQMCSRNLPRPRPLSARRGAFRCSINWVDSERRQGRLLPFDRGSSTKTMQ